MMVRKAAPWRAAAASAAGALALAGAWLWMAALLAAWALALSAWGVVVLATAAWISAAKARRLRWDQLAHVGAGELVSVQTSDIVWEGELLSKTRHGVVVRPRPGPAPTVFVPWELVEFVASDFPPEGEEEGAGEKVVDIRRGGRPRGGDGPPPL